MASVQPKLGYFIDPKLEDRPIAPILEFLHQSLVTIAPERSEDLTEIGTLHVGVLDDPTFCARAYPKQQRIEISGPFVEAMWCAAFAYWSFRKVLEDEANKSHEGPLELNLTDNRVTLALTVLKEGIAAAVEGRHVRWETLAVSPKDPRLMSTFESCASEMTLAAVGFVLHHELAHIRGAHTTGDRDWTLESEKEADTEAVEQVLGMVHGFAKDDESTAKCVAKRGWGILIATGFLNDVRAERARRRGAISPAGDHPSPFERLDKAIQHQVVQTDPLIKETLESLATAILVPHIRLDDLPLPDVVNDYTDLYSTCLDTIANHRTA